MAIVETFDVQLAVSLDEFAAAAQHIDENDERSIHSLAPMLHGLSSNDTLLRDFIAAGLQDLANFQSGNLYSAQSYILRKVSERSFLRLAVWPGSDTALRDDESKFFAYDTAHDHAFSLLTTNLLGSGYVTDIYQLRDPDAVAGYLCEPVALTPPARVKLSKGTVILYEAGKDIHIQYPPDDLSVSLNFLVDQSERCPQQRFYDVKAGIISGYGENAKRKRGGFMALAAMLEDEECNGLIWQIGTVHPCPLTRSFALRALALRGDAEAARASMLADPSPVVRGAAALKGDRFADLLTA
jgi:hypothetical protein